MTYQEVPVNIQLCKTKLFIYLLSLRDMQKKKKKRITIPALGSLRNKDNVKEN